MFCSKCGNEVNETSSYCPKCGAQLNNDFLSRIQVNNDSLSNNKEGEKLASKAWIFALLAFLCSPLGIVAIVLAIKSRKLTGGYFCKKAKDAFIASIILMTLSIVAYVLLIYANGVNRRSVGYITSKVNEYTVVIDDKVGKIPKSYIQKYPDSFWQDMRAIASYGYNVVFCTIESEDSAEEIAAQISNSYNSRSIVIVVNRTEDAVSLTGFATYICKDILDESVPYITADDYGVFAEKAFSIIKGWIEWYNEDTSLSPSPVVSEKVNRELENNAIGTVKAAVQTVVANTMDRGKAMPEKIVINPDGQFTYWYSDDCSFFVDLLVDALEGYSQIGFTDNLVVTISSEGFVKVEKER